MSDPPPGPPRGEAQPSTPKGRNQPPNPPRGGGAYHQTPQGGLKEGIKF